MPTLIKLIMLVKSSSALSVLLAYTYPEVTCFLVTDSMNAKLFFLLVVPTPSVGVNDAANHDQPANSQ